MYAVIEDKSFEPRQKMTTFRSHDRAAGYLKWLWQNEMAGKMEDLMDLDERNCSLVGDSAVVSWMNGETAKFFILRESEPDQRFAKGNFTG